MAIRKLLVLLVFFSFSALNAKVLIVDGKSQADNPKQETSNSINLEKIRTDSKEIENKVQDNYDEIQHKSSKKFYKTYDYIQLEVSKAYHNTVDFIKKTLK